MQQTLHQGEVINTCADVDMEQPQPHHQDGHLSHQYEFMDHIERAYDWNAARLLDMILRENMLLKRLESMNHSFFFDRGDFFTHFIDGC